MRPAEKQGRFSRPAQDPASAAQQHLGWRVLVPGLAQLSWHQRKRGLVFLLSFLTSLVTGLFCWGTWVGWSFLFFCFFSHVAAYLDLARQRSFPVFRRTVALSAAALGLGLTVYLPAALLLQTCAFATPPDPTTRVAYLVNPGLTRLKNLRQATMSGCVCRRRRCPEPVRSWRLPVRKSSGQVEPGGWMAGASSHCIPDRCPVTLVPGDSGSLQITF